MNRREFPEKPAKIEAALGELIKLKLFKSWNVFGTRMFYFGPVGQDAAEDGAFRLTLDCPWRIEQYSRILVGYQDYGLKASDNSDPNWNPQDDQLGHLQDQKLKEILGATEGGYIFNVRNILVVESVRADAVGGFQIGLSGGYALSVFPLGVDEVEWLLSRPTGGNLALQGNVLSESADRT
jgi:hypothetical protein